MNAQHAVRSTKVVEYDARMVLRGNEVAELRDLARKIVGGFYNGRTTGLTVTAAEAALLSNVLYNTGWMDTFTAEEIREREALEALAAAEAAAATEDPDEEGESIPW